MRPYGVQAPSDGVEGLRIMSKRTWVGFGRSRCRGSNLVAAVVGLPVAGLIVAGGLTGRLGLAPGVVVEAAQPAAADGGFTAEQADAGWAVAG